MSNIGSRRVERVKADNFMVECVESLIVDG